MSHEHWASSFHLAFLKLNEIFLKRTSYTQSQFMAHINHKKLMFFNFSLFQINELNREKRKQVWEESKIEGVQPNTIKKKKIHQIYCFKCFVFIFGILYGIFFSISSCKPFYQIPESMIILIANIPNEIRLKKQYF